MSEPAISPPGAVAPVDATRPYRILSIDGGAYLGLATAAFIEGIESHFKVRFADRFDLFCGTSTGAILALGLAAGRSGQELRELYERLGKTVFQHKRLLRGYLWNAKYSSQPLADALTTEFRSPSGQDLTLGDLHRRNKLAIVTAFNLTTGSPRVFKTDHSPGLSTDNGLKLADIALASSAAPYYFPAAKVWNPVKGTTELFCDGGVVANHPALLGYIEAIYELKWPVEQLRILSLSTPATDFAEGAGTVDKRDRSLYAWGAKLPSMFIEAGSAISGEILRRLLAVLPSNVRPRYERIGMKNLGKYPIDCATKAAVDALKLEGATQAVDGKVRTQVETIIC